MLRLTGRIAGSYSGRHQAKGGGRIHCVAMTILLVLSSVSDLKQYRIPNDLIVAGWLVALLLRWYEQGLVGVGAGVCCVLLGTAALLPMFCIH